MDSEELQTQLTDNLSKQKFDCDDCGATVGGEWLDKHSEWHNRIEGLEEYATISARAIANLANPDRIKK